MSTKLSFVPRLSHERGNADHGWLKTFHTFDFASYQGSGHDGFGPLRVINEDRVAPGTGFGTHPHREYEIFSYIVNGQLEHRDSMNNTEVLSRGDIQLTSAGTGISHSEKTHGPNPVHFLQIWSKPHTRGLQPAYYTRHFPDSDKQDVWKVVVAPITSNKSLPNARDESGTPAPVHSRLTMYASLISPGRTMTAHPVTTPRAYLHVVQTSGYNEGASSGASVSVSTGADEQKVVLREGDGLYIQKNGTELAELIVRNEGEKVAEVVLFDLD